MLQQLETVSLHNVLKVIVTVRDEAGNDTDIYVDVLDDNQNKEVIKEVRELMDPDEFVVEITFDMLGGATPPKLN